MFFVVLNSFKKIGNPLKKLSAFTPLKETKKCLKLVFIYIFPLIAFAVSSSLNCAHFMKIVEFQATWN